MDRQVRATPSIILQRPRDWVLVSGVIYHRFTRANVVSHTSLLEIWGFWFQLFDRRKEKTFRLIIAVIFCFHALRVSLAWAGLPSMPLSQIARSSCMGTSVASCRTANHWSYWKTSVRPGPGRGERRPRGGLCSGTSNFSPNQAWETENQTAQHVHTEKHTKLSRGHSDPSHRSHALAPDRRDPAEIRTVSKH